VALHWKHAWVICKRREQAIGTSDHVYSSSYLLSSARLVITNEGQYIELLGSGIFWVVIGIRQGGWGYAAESEFDKSRPEYHLLVSFGGNVMTQVLIRNEDYLLG